MVSKGDELIHSTLRQPGAVASSGIFGNSSLRRDTGSLRPLRRRKANVAHTISFSHNLSLDGDHCLTRFCICLYAAPQRTDWKLVVVSDLFTWAEVSFGVNDNLRLVRNLYDLSIAIWFATVIDEACQIPLQPRHSE